MIVRWDDVEVGRDIGLAAGAVNVGLHRLEIAPGETAAQADAPVEEIVFVLEGSGSWENGEETSQVRAGSCGVRPAQDQGHLLRAGKDGLTVIAFVSPVARKLFANPTARKPNIVNLEEIEADYEGESGKWVVVARKAGAVLGGLNWGYLEPGKSGAARISIPRTRRSSSSSKAAARSSSGLLPSAPRTPSAKSTRSGPATSFGGRRAPGSLTSSAAGTKE